MAVIAVLAVAGGLTVAAMPPGHTGYAAIGAGGAGGADGGFSVTARPLSFEPNRGQAPAAAAFLAHGHGYSVGLGATGATLTMGAPPARRPTASAPGGTAVVRLALAGANSAARGAGEGTLPGTAGYLSARGARPGLAAIPTYAAVRFAGVYPGVDVVYYGAGPHLEYDFRVAPGADPRRIRLAADGAAAVALAANGDLVVRAGGVVIRQHRPVIYQFVHGARRTIPGGYALAGRTVGFRLGAYDPRLPLVIDPVLVYSTYYGGAGDDITEAIAVDGQGDVYVAGNTNTPGSKTRVVFISKLDPTGRRVLYTKYISNGYGSGAATSCDSIATGIAVDGRGNAYVTGSYGDQLDDTDTHCSNDDVLWARVAPAGRAVVKTFGTYGGNKGRAIAVDGQGNSYLTGLTDQRPNNFPVTPGAFQTSAGIDKVSSAGIAGDAFVLKVDPSGREVYGTFLGGSGIDTGNGIAVDKQGQAYVVGTTGIEPEISYSNFPLTRTAYQLRPRSLWSIGFLSKLSADGSTLLYSTLLSGNDGEAPRAVAVDDRGDAYVAGETTSDDYPTTPGAYNRRCGTNGYCNVGQACHYDQVNATNVCHTGSLEDAFVSMVDTTRAGATSLVYSTFLGGGSRDMAEAIAVDGAGRAYVTGRTLSRDFPMVHSLRRGAGWDAFVAEVDPGQSGTASLPFSSYLGGNGADEGNGIALDRDGNVYVTGDTGSTAGLPTRDAMQSGNAGGYDAFIVKIGGLAARP